MKSQLDLLDLLIEFHGKDDDGVVFSFVKINELERIIREYQENPLLAETKKIVNVYLVQFDALNGVYKPIDLSVYKWKKDEKSS